MPRGFVHLVFLIGLCFPIFSYAENYVAAGIGIDVCSFDTTTSGKCLSRKIFSTAGKIGHYFNDRGFNWFGLEIDAYRSTPGIEQQTLPRSFRSFLVRKDPWRHFARTFSGLQCSGSGYGIPIQNGALRWARHRTQYGKSFRWELQTGSILCPKLQYFGRPKILSHSKSPLLSSTSITWPSSTSLVATLPPITALICSCSVLPTISDGNAVLHCRGIHPSCYPG